MKKNGKKRGSLSKEAFSNNKENINNPAPKLYPQVSEYQPHTYTELEAKTKVKHTRYGSLASELKKERIAKKIDFSFLKLGVQRTCNNKFYTQIGMALNRVQETRYNR